MAFERINCYLKLENKLLILISLAHGSKCLDRLVQSSWLNIAIYQLDCRSAWLQLLIWHPFVYVFLNLSIRFERAVVLAMLQILPLFTVAMLFFVWLSILEFPARCADGTKAPLVWLVRGAEV